MRPLSILAVLFATLVQGTAQDDGAGDAAPAHLDPAIETAHRAHAVYDKAKSAMDRAMKAYRKVPSTEKETKQEARLDSLVKRAKQHKRHVNHARDALGRLQEIGVFCLHLFDDGRYELAKEGLAQTELMAI